MGPAPIEDGRGRGFVAEVDSNRDLHTRTRVVNGDNEAEVTAEGELLTRSMIVNGDNEANVTADGELVTRSTIAGGGNELAVDSDGAISANIVGDGNAASVDSDGRLLTSAVIPCVSKVVYTNYLSGTANTVGTLNSRSDRCALFLQNTGSVTIYFKLADSNPNSTDASLAPGASIQFDRAFGSEARVVGTAGSWSAVAIEWADS